MEFDFTKKAKKITKILKIFFKKETDIKNDSAQLVKAALEKSENKKIADIKNKITQL